MSVLPPSWQQKLREEQPDPSKHDNELAILLDASIEARPLHLPSNSKVKLKDSSYIIYKVRRKIGPDPDVTRYLELKMAGYSNVTLEDIENPKELTAHINVDKTEITEGQDLIWMKAKKEIHYGAMKFHQQRALQMTSPRKGTAQESLMRSTPLGTSERQALDASHTHVPGADEASRYESRASANNSVQRGTPQWEEIANEAKGKKEK